MDYILLDLTLHKNFRSSQLQNFHLPMTILILELNGREIPLELSSFCVYWNMNIPSNKFQFTHYFNNFWHSGS